MPGFAAAVASDPGFFFSRFPGSQSDKPSNEAVHAIWKLAKPRTTREGSPEERVSNAIGSNRAARAALVGAWCGRMWGMFDPDGIVHPTRTTPEETLHAAWNTRDADDPILPSSTSASELILAAQQLVTHTVLSNPVLLRTVRETGAWFALRNELESARSAVAPFRGADVIHRVPSGLMTALCAKYGSMAGPLPEEDVPVLHAIVPWLFRRMNEAHSAGDLDGEVNGINPRDHAAVRILFRTVFQVMGVDSDAPAKFERLVRCYHMVNCTEPELQSAIKGVATLSKRAISIMCATARGISVIGRCRVALLDKATARRQAEIVAQTSAHMSGLGHYAFCGVCEKPAVPLKVQKRNHVSRQIKPHANYTKLSQRRGDAPLEAGERHTSVGFVATLCLDQDNPNSETIGKYVCSAGTTPACSKTEISAIDCRGVVFTSAGESVQICERCGGFFKHHSASKWFGLSRVCDPCDIQPPKNNCAVCNAVFFPSVETDGLTRTCQRCSSSCWRCHKKTPKDYGASVAGRALACAGCAASCIVCGGPATDWLVASRPPGRALCSECHGKCPVCKTVRRRPKDPTAPDQEPCQACVRQEKLAERRMLRMGQKTTGWGEAGRGRVSFKPKETQPDNIEQIVRRIRMGRDPEE